MAMDIHGIRLADVSLVPGGARPLDRNSPEQVAAARGWTSFVASLPERVAEMARQAADGGTVVSGVLVDRDGNEIDPVVRLSTDPDPAEAAEAIDELMDKAAEELDPGEEDGEEDGEDFVGAATFSLQIPPRDYVTLTELTSYFARPFHWAKDSEGPDVQVYAEDAPGFFQEHFRRPLPKVIEGDEAREILAEWVDNNYDSVERAVTGMPGWMVEALRAELAYALERPKLIGAARMDLERVERAHDVLHAPENIS